MSDLKTTTFARERGVCHVGQIRCKMALTAMPSSLDIPQKKKRMGGHVSLAFGGEQMAKLTLALASLHNTRHTTMSAVTHSSAFLSAKARVAPGAAKVRAAAASRPTARRAFVVRAADKKKGTCL